MVKCLVCESDDLEIISVSTWEHGTSANIYHCKHCDANWVICDCENCREKLDDIGNDVNSKVDY